MSRLWANNYRNNVVSKNELLMKRPVEDEVKLVLRMCPGYALEVLVSEPANAFEFSMNQESGIYRNFQINDF